MIGKCLLLHSESLGNGRSGNIGVEHCGMIACAHGVYCQKACDEGFADSALAAHDGYDLFDGAVLVKVSTKISLFALAVEGAAVAIMGAFFAHFSKLLIFVLFF